MTPFHSKYFANYLTLNSYNVYKNSNKQKKTIVEELINFLRTHQERTEHALDERKKCLFHLVEAELGDRAIIDHKQYSFTFTDSTGKPKKYFLNWQQAEEQDGIFFHDNHPLAEELLKIAASRNLDPSHVIFNYSQYQGKISSLEQLVGKKGWLEVDRLSIDAFEQEEFLLCSAKMDDGTPIDPDVAHKFFSLSAKVNRQIISDTTSLQSIKDIYIRDRLEELEKRAESFYEKSSEQIERWSEDLEIRVEREYEDLNKEFKEAKKSRNTRLTQYDKVSYEKLISVLENKRISTRKKICEEHDRIVQELGKMIDHLEAYLKPKIKIKPLFTIRWEIQ